MSGFAIKTPDRRVVLIDPYLSDFVPDPPGWTRRDVSPLQAEEVAVDHVLFTHDDFDHLDPVAVPRLAIASPNAIFACPPVCSRQLKAWGIERARIIPVEPGHAAEIGRIRLSAVFAIHSPGCAGLLLDFRPGQVYAVGDTMWDQRLLANPAHVDMMLAPITPPGSDNLTVDEAAELVSKLKPANVIPCHFGTFDVFDSDPADFVRSLNERRVETRTAVLQPGERYDFAVGSGVD